MGDDMHRFSLDCEKLFAGTTLSPVRAFYTGSENNVISRNFAVAETGFEPATARPPSRNDLVAWRGFDGLARLNWAELAGCAHFGPRIGPSPHGDHVLPARRASRRVEQQAGSGALVIPARESAHRRKVARMSAARRALYVNRCTNLSAVSATSRQPLSIVSEWPRFGTLVISVTAGLRRCRL